MVFFGFSSTQRTPSLKSVFFRPPNKKSRHKKQNKQQTNGGFPFGFQGYRLKQRHTSNYLSPHGSKWPSKSFILGICQPTRGSFGFPCKYETAKGTLWLTPFGRVQEHQNKASHSRVPRILRSLFFRRPPIKK